jgi:hypothetical protein
MLSGFILFFCEYKRALGSVRSREGSSQRLMLEIQDMSPL